MEQSFYHFDICQHPTALLFEEKKNCCLNDLFLQFYFYLFSMFFNKAFKFKKKSPVLIQNVATHTSSSIFVLAL